MTPFEYRQQEMYAEGVPVKRLAAEHGTPLFVYSQQKIVDNWQQFHQHWPAPNRLCYAVKANSNIAILELLAELGAGFDIVSAGELQRVLAAGGRAQDVVFSGVAKSVAEITFALQQGVGCINVESAAELERIQQIAESLGVQAPVSLRVNPDVDAQTHPYIATGMKANKFGIAMADAMPVFERAHQLSHINLLGADCHIGSQIMRPEPFLDAAERMFDLVERLQKQDIALSHLDLGGGFGVSYEGKENLDVERYLTGVLQRAEQHPEITLLLEPGRAIVADAGVLVTQVEHLKHTAEKSFVLVDAGMNDLLRPSLYQAWHDIVAVDEEKNQQAALVDVVGPVCETGCFLGHARHLAVEEGDLLVIKHAGAYGFTMSSNYNTRCRPAEVLVDGEQHYLIRERETFADLIRGEHRVKKD